MPVRPKDENWADETREGELISAQDAEDGEAEAEAPSRDTDDDPDSCAGDPVPDPLAGDDD